MKKSSSVTRTTALLAAVALVGTVSGCSGGGASTTKPDSGAPLEVWSRSTPEAALTYTKVLAAFTKKTGVKVNYKAVEEFDTQLQARASQKDLPDVLINDAGLMGTYVSQGFLLPIDRNSIKGQADVSDASWKQNVGLDGKSYGIPWSRQAMVTFVRKDWREKVGLPVPKTWAELATLADAFATKDPDGDGKNDTYGMVVPGSSKKGYIGWWASSYIWQAGGELLASTGKGTYKSAINSPETAAAVTWIRDQFCTPGHVVPGSLNLTTANIPFFAEGKAGIYLTGPYNISVFDKALGKKNVEVIPMPAGPKSTTALAEGENIYFGAGSDKVAAQKELAEYLISSEGQRLAMTSEAQPSGGRSQAAVRLPVNTTVDVLKVTGDARWQLVADEYRSDSKTFDWSINFQPFRQALGEGINAIAADCSSDVGAGLASIDKAFTTELQSQSLLK